MNLATRKARGWKTGPSVHLTISKRREGGIGALSRFKRDESRKVPPEKGRDKTRRGERSVHRWRTARKRACRGHDYRRRVSLCFVGGDDNDDATSSGGSNAHRVREFPMAGPPPSMVVARGSIAVAIAPIMVANVNNVTFNVTFNVTILIFPFTSR